jgi:hypothetical protein
MEPTKLEFLKKKLQESQGAVDEYKALWFDAAVNEINSRIDTAVSFGIRTADFSFGTLQTIVLNNETDPKEKNLKHKLLNQVGKDILTEIRKKFEDSGYSVRLVDEGNSGLFTVGVPVDA